MNNILKHQSMHKFDSEPTAQTTLALPAGRAEKVAQEFIGVAKNKGFRVHAAFWHYRYNKLAQYEPAGLCRTKRVSLPDRLQVTVWGDDAEQWMQQGVKLFQLDRVRAD